MAKPDKNLTEKQKAFCREYILDWNATRAAKMAGYSEKTAEVIGFENLRKPNIKDYIEEIQKDLEKQAGISRLMVVNEFKKMAFSSIAHLHNTWVERKEFEKLTEEQKACIEEISTRVRKVEPKDLEPFYVEEIKIKLHSKTRALENINKMLGYNAVEKTEVSGEIPINVKISYVESKNNGK